MINSCFHVRLMLRTLLGVFVVACSNISVHAQQKVGYVLDISGEWHVEGISRQKLHRGGSLYSRAVVKTPAPEVISNFIVIADLNGRIIDSRYCRDAGTCNNPIRLPSVTASQPSVFSRVYEAVMGLWGSDSAKYKTYGSRSGSGTLQEAVILLKDGQIDLKPAFEGMPEEKYWIRLVEVPCQDLSKCKTVLGPVEFYWASNKTSLLSAPNLTQGIYEVQLLNRNTNLPTQIGTEAWILVSAPSKFETLSSSFEQAVELTKAWDSSMKSLSKSNNVKRVKRTTISSFLRGTLDYLATEAIKNSNK